jgi:hypothetical protein
MLTKFYNIISMKESDTMEQHEEASPRYLAF